MIPTWKGWLAILALAGGIIALGAYKTHAAGLIFSPIAQVYLPGSCNREAINATLMRKDVTVQRMSHAEIRAEMEAAIVRGNFQPTWIKPEAGPWAMVGKRLDGTGWHIFLNADAPLETQMNALDVDACRIITNLKWQYTIRQ